MEKQIVEKMGPIEKTQKGWPINPLGVVAFAVVIVFAAFLITKPLLERKTVTTSVNTTDEIISPLSGQIIKGNQLPLELKVDDPSKIAKVQFWGKTYVDNNWSVIGEVESAPFKFNWQIPQEFQNKAVAITVHVYLKDGNVVNDPGGWREGIIILSQ